MNLYRFRIVPESAWRTPWQSDTFSGLLCGAIARLDGNEVLRREVIEPALAGRPPFVVSDAFPGDRLPVPAFIRLFPSWPPDERKAVKRARGSAPKRSGEPNAASYQRGETLSPTPVFTSAAVTQYHKPGQQYHDGQGWTLFPRGNLSRRRPRLSNSLRPPERRFPRLVLACRPRTRDRRLRSGPICGKGAVPG